MGDEFYSVIKLTTGESTSLSRTTLSTGTRHTPNTTPDPFSSTPGTVSGPPPPLLSFPPLHAAPLAARTIMLVCMDHPCICCLGACLVQERLRSVPHHSPLTSVANYAGPSLFLDHSRRESQNGHGRVRRVSSLHLGRTVALGVLLV